MKTNIFLLIFAFSFTELSAQSDSIIIETILDSALVEHNTIFKIDLWATRSVPQVGNNSSQLFGIKISANISYGNYSYARMFVVGPSGRCRIAEIIVCLLLSPPPVTIQGY